MHAEMQAICHRSNINDAGIGRGLSRVHPATNGQIVNKFITVSRDLIGWSLGAINAATHRVNRARPLALLGAKRQTDVNESGKGS